MPRPHSNSRVDKAGDYISNRVPWPVPQDAWDSWLDGEIEVLNAWRALHAVPLDAVSRQLAVRANGIDATAIFSQRLKRLRAIRNKLMNAPAMQMTTMQDIAGCRAVVKTIAQVYALKKRYESYAVRLPGIGSQLIPAWTKDYILHPKPDGYRSIHLVMKFRTTKPHQIHCNGLRVEIQIRSDAQHAWATAVETASAVTSQALKSGEGEEDWKQFFRLMGDFIAMREECPLLVGTAENEAALRQEAADLAVKLKVIPLLEGMRHVVQTFKGTGDDDYYLLTLNPNRLTIRYEGFKQSDFAKAKEAYSLAERVYKNDPDMNVVLVRVESIEHLKEAYPSYFLDSSNFIGHVKDLFSSTGI